VTVTLPAAKPTTASRLAIRAARWTDWPQLQPLVLSIFPHLSPVEASFLLRRHHAGTVIAYRDATPVGYYQFYPHAEPGVAWLNHFGVEPDSRGRGDAVDLLRFFERHAVSAGFDSAALDAFEDNVRAHRFYERMGFSFISTQAHDDGVKCRYRKALSGVEALARVMPSLRPPSRWTLACRKLAFAALVPAR
jgi:GNAT superfamily N-acetyltransferase